VRVYRPSLITPSTGAVGSRDDIMVRLLAFMLKYGVGVNARNQLSFLPADIAAHNIAAILGQRQVPARTLHVTVDDYYNMMDVTRLITREYGYTFAYHEYPEFVSEMNRLCTKDDPLYPLLDFFNRSHPKLSAMQHKRYVNDRYKEARAATGVGRGEPGLSETVSYFMEFMLREGIVEPARAPRPAQKDATPPRPAQAADRKATKNPA
jgi:thioester reductase-like protein